MSHKPTQSAVVARPAVENRAEIPLSEIETAIRSIQHGTVQIIIQDGKVVQIDKTEKLRLR